MNLAQLLAKKILDGAMKPENLKLSKKSKDTLIGAGGLIVFSLIASYQINKK
jgi:hypothetical protein